MSTSPFLEIDVDCDGLWGVPSNMRRTFSEQPANQNGLLGLENSGGGREWTIDKWNSIPSNSLSANGACTNPDRHSPEKCDPGYVVHFFDLADVSEALANHDSEPAKLSASLQASFLDSVRQEDHP